MPAVETVEELKELKASMQDTQPVGSLLNCCCTLDQVVKHNYLTATNSSLKLNRISG
jgi:hypothetical protein